MGRRGRNRHDTRPGGSGPPRTAMNTYPRASHARPWDSVSFCWCHWWRHNTPTVAWSSVSVRRLAALLGAGSTNPPRGAWSCRVMRTMPATRSMSHHRRRTASPRRSPPWAHSATAWSVHTTGRAPLPGSNRSPRAGLVGSNRSRTAVFRAVRRVARTRCTAAGEPLPHGGGVPGDRVERLLYLV